MMNTKQMCVLFFLMAILLLWVVGNVPAGSETIEEVTAEAPDAIVHHLDAASAQSEPNQLQPGLAVTYYDKKIRHLDELAKDKKLARKARSGKPVLFLDHRFGRGEVFDSGKKQAVVMRMSGFVHFVRSGRYAIRANSNDGIRIFVDGRMIVNDPDVHAARLTVPGIAVVEKPGWYPVLIQYFQRKGTAALSLFWQEPGSDRYVVIPAGVYAHLDSAQ
jgi:hypothetical protein